MKITNAPLKTLKGDDMQSSTNPPGMLPNADDPVLLISDVLSNVALSPSANAPYEPSKTAARYQLAISLFNKKLGDELDIPQELIMELDRDTARHYSVIVSGQIHLLLK